jgi:hypothetical protein
MVGLGWLLSRACGIFLVACGCIGLAFSNGGRVREASSFLRDSGDEGAIVRRISHVKGLGKDVHVMLLSHLLRRGLQNLLVARAHGDAATLRGERFRPGTTNPLTRGCDQRDSIFQSKIHEAGIQNGTQ